MILTRREMALASSSLPSTRPRKGGGCVSIEDKGAPDLPRLPFSDGLELFGVSHGNWVAGEEGAVVDRVGEKRGVYPAPFPRETLAEPCPTHAPNVREPTHEAMRVSEAVGTRNPHGCVRS